MPRRQRKNTTRQPRNKSKYRDGLFRDYFNNQERLMHLCNALLGEDATDPDEVEINTLDGIFFSQAKNDLSCLFRGHFLVIMEHMSTKNENMPLRMLWPFAVYCG